MSLSFQENISELSGWCLYYEGPLSWVSTSQETHFLSIIENIHIIVLREINIFWRVLKTAKSSLVSSCLIVCMSVRPHGTTRLPLKEFSWNLIFEYFRKSVEKMQVSLKSAKTNAYFAWRQMYTLDHISLNSSYNEKYVRKISREAKTHISCSITIFLNPTVYDSVENYCRAIQMTICWVTRLTNTH